MTRAPVKISPHAVTQTDFRANPRVEVAVGLVRLMPSVILSTHSVGPQFLYGTSAADATGLDASATLADQDLDVPSEAALLDRPRPELAYRSVPVRISAASTTTLLLPLDVATLPRDVLRPSREGPPFELVFSVERRVICLVVVIRRLTDPPQYLIPRRTHLRGHKTDQVMLCC